MVHAPVTLPVLSGVLPPLAAGYSARPDTGLDPETGLAPGETVVLAQPREAGRPPLAAMGGTGKTQMAAGLAHAWWHSGGGDLLAWIPASSRDAILGGYAQALADLGMADPDGDQESAARRFAAWLAQAERPWLVILDDLTDPSDLTDLWPSGAVGRAVVTTQLPAAALQAPGRRTLPVGPLSSSEAVAYLAARLHHDPAKRAGSLDLAEDLGCLPLGLDLAASLIADCDLACRAYQEQFARQRQEAAEWVPDADGFTTAIAAAWSLSLDRADQLPPAGMAQSALALASLLSPAGIPGAVLTSKAACEYITGERSVGGMADESRARAALANLARTGLVSIDPVSTLRTVRVHPLVQSWTRQALSSGAMEEAARAAADGLMQAWPEHDNPATLARILRECAAALHEAAPGPLWSPEGHEVLMRSGHSLDRARLAGPAASYWEGLAAAGSAALGADHPQVLHCRDRLGASLAAAGRFGDAIAVRRQNLAERQRILGQDHPETLTSRAHLAATLLADGRPAAAVPDYEQVLTGREWVLGPDHPDTLAARSDLAGAYRAAGRPAEAITIFQRALTDRELVLGRNHPGTLAARADLASVYRACGQPAKAIPLYKQILAEQERSLDPDHPDTAATWASLAYAYRSAGRLKDAIPAYKRALADRERILGPDHPDTIASRANMASAYHSAHLLKDALPLYEQDVAARERVHGADHPATLIARGNLASAYQSAGRLVEAIPIYEQALSGFERLCGPDHPDTLTSRANLAGAYHAAHRLADAASLYQRTLADCQRALPTDHPLTKVVRENLAMVTDG